ncbi:MAG: endo alpha-1,4 polygalactosaminidase [Paludibacteraceae bacterium]
MKKTYAIILAACTLTACEHPTDIDFRQEMRDFVIAISHTAKQQKSTFIVIPQNGIELVTLNGDSDGTPATGYLAAIDGYGQEDLFYGYDGDDRATTTENTNYLKAFLKRTQTLGKTVLITDYCSTPAKINDSYAQNHAEGFLSFAAHRRTLDQIPTTPVYNENNDKITKLSEAKNFLYLINPEQFATKQTFIEAVCATNYDLVIMDLFFQDGTAFTASEITQLRSKANGGNRLVIAYMSIGEAEDYRYYWQATWRTHKPTWIAAANPDWEGNYKVCYWDQTWQNIIYGATDSYLNRILAADFDGVYLDIIDAFEYFE